MSAFTRPLPSGNHQDEEPTSAAALSIELEPVAPPTVGELVRDLTAATVHAMSGHTSARRKDNRT